jgi:hypothetical protein
LQTIDPGIPWSVKNQARMHIRNDDPPYLSSTDAISQFPETPTAIGVGFNNKDEVILTSPCGVHDLVNLVVRPTESIITNVVTKGKLYEDRLHKKKWDQHWHRLKIVYLSDANRR